MPRTKKVKGKRGEALLRLAARKANILKALGHPIRITVFEALAGGEKTVAELAELVGQKDANTSRHLAVMRAAELVSTRKDGLNVFYSINLPCLVQMLSCLEDGVCECADDQTEMAGLIRSKAVKSRSKSGPSK